MISLEIGTFGNAGLPADQRYLRCGDRLFIEEKRGDGRQLYVVRTDAGGNRRILYIGWFAYSHQVHAHVRRVATNNQMTPEDLVGALVDRTVDDESDRVEKTLWALIDEGVAG